MSHELCWNVFLCISVSKYFGLWSLCTAQTDDHLLNDDKCLSVLLVSIGVTLSTVLKETGRRLTYQQTDRQSHNLVRFLSQPSFGVVCASCRPNFICYESTEMRGRGSERQDVLYKP